MQIVSSTLVKRCCDYRSLTREVMTRDGKTVGYWVTDINGAWVSDFTPVNQARGCAKAMAQPRNARTQRRQKVAYASAKAATTKSAKLCFQRTKRMTAHHAIFCRPCPSKLPQCHRG